jgi:hypothetical protein
MKTDAYTKTVLTVIAVCLSVLVLKQINIIPSAYAQAPDTTVNSGPKYGLVPLNSDGSIDVNIKSSSITTDVNIASSSIEMDVNIVKTAGRKCSWMVPVIVELNKDK